MESLQDPDTIHSIQELWRGGWRPVVLGLMSEGMEAKAIQGVLENEYGVRCDYQVLWRAMRTLGDKAQLESLAMRRQLMDLQKIATERSNHHLDRYSKAEAKPDPDMMQFHDTAAGKWFDRSLKFHLSDAPVVAIQNNVVDPTAIFVKAFADEPEKAEKYLEELRRSQGVIDTEGGVKGDTA